MVKNSEWANGSQSDQCLHPADYQPTLELGVLVGLSDVFVPCSNMCRYPPCLSSVLTCKYINGLLYFS